MDSLTDAAAAEYAQWFRVLADATRIKILHHVAAAKRPLTVGEIVDRTDRSQSTVSTHLKILADSRYVFCEPDGVRTLVRVNEACMAALPEAAATIMATRIEVTDVVAS